MLGLIETMQSIDFAEREDNTLRMIALCARYGKLSPIDGMNVCGVWLVSYHRHVQAIVAEENRKSS